MVIWGPPCASSQVAPKPPGAACCAHAWCEMIPAHIYLVYNILMESIELSREENNRQIRTPVCFRRINRNNSARINAERIPHIFSFIDNEKRRGGSKDNKRGIQRQPLKRKRLVLRCKTKGRGEFLCSLACIMACS